MGFFSAFRVALAALLVHKGRSMLTSLGIVIGTGAVIAMVSAAGGARRKLDERLDNVGKNLILIRAGARTQHGAFADVKPLTNEEAALLRKQLRHLIQGVAEMQATIRLASTRTHNCITMITGTSPDMRKVRTWQIEQGRFLTEEDLKKQAAVCVLGQTVQNQAVPRPAQSRSAKSSASIGCALQSGRRHGGQGTLADRRRPGRPDIRAAQHAAAQARRRRKPEPNPHVRRRRWT